MPLLFVSRKFPPHLGPCPSLLDIHPNPHPYHRYLKSLCAHRTFFTQTDRHTHRHACIHINYTHTCTHTHLIAQTHIQIQRYTHTHTQKIYKHHYEHTAAPLDERDELTISTVLNTTLAVGVLTKQTENIHEALISIVLSNNTNNINTNNIDTGTYY